MEIINDNSIKKFICELCQNYNFCLRLTTKNKETGYLCDKCFETYSKRKKYFYLVNLNK